MGGFEIGSLLNSEYNAQTSAASLPRNVRSEGLASDCLALTAAGARNLHENSIEALRRRRRIVRQRRLVTRPVQPARTG